MTRKGSLITLSETEILEGLPPARVAELLFLDNEASVRRLRRGGRITGTGRRGRYEAESVLRERRRRLAVASGGDAV